MPKVLLAALLLAALRTLAVAGIREAAAPGLGVPPLPRRHGAFIVKDPAARRYAASAPGSAEDDRMSDEARRGYEAAILGADRGIVSASSGLAQEAARPETGETFVNVAFDLKDHHELKDAVAGLSSAAGFRADNRFAPEHFVAEGSVHVAMRGWIPTHLIAQAARAPGVSRLELGRGGLRRPDGAATASIVVGIRIPARAKAAETFQRVVSELSQTAQFRWTSTLGFQAVPETQEVALLIVGELPVYRISRLLGHPDVLKIGPDLPQGAARGEAAAVDEPHGSFVQFVVDRAPLLLIATLLLLMPTVGAFVARGLRAFIPYH